MGDDFYYVRFAVARIAYFEKFCGGDFAIVLGKCLCKFHGNGGLAVLACAGPVGFDLCAGKAGLAAKRGMGGYTVFTRILLGQGQGDAFTGFGVEAAFTGYVMQSQERSQRGG